MFQTVYLKKKNVVIVENIKIYGALEKNKKTNCNIERHLCCGHLSVVYWSYFCSLKLKVYKLCKII